VVSGFKGASFQGALVFLRRLQSIDERKINLASF
jgi:hypothetical protein